jgi:hypothetical protein
MRTPPPSTPPPTPTPPTHPSSHSLSRAVFNETLFGPSAYRGPNAADNNPEDFHPSYPLTSRPNFKSEFKYFRQLDSSKDDGAELQIDMLLGFCHFTPVDELQHSLGRPPLDGSGPAAVRCLSEDDAVNSSKADGRPAKVERAKTERSRRRTDRFDEVSV